MTNQSHNQPNAQSRQHAHAPRMAPSEIAASIPEPQPQQQPQQQPRRPAPRRRMLSVQVLSMLPFVALDFDDASGATSLNFWNVNPTGDYAEDNKTGKQYAYELVVYIAREQTPSILAQVIRGIQEMTKYRPWSGIEAGFFHEVAMCTMPVVAAASASLQH